MPPAPLAEQPVGVLTMDRSRGAHLARVLEGLARNSRRADLCVLVELNDSPAPLPATPFPTT